jgi:hypothetical protein
MSITLLILSIIVILVMAILTLQIRSARKRENSSLPFLDFYSENLHLFFTGKIVVQGVICFVHYLILHLVVPLVGLGLLLRTDLNFLVIFAAIFTSMQIVQRVYPAVPSMPDEEDSEAGESR